MSWFWRVKAEAAAEAILHGRRIFYAP